MLYSPGRVIAILVAGMMAGGFLGFLLRSAVLFIVAYLVLASAIERPRPQVASAALAVAGAASGGYHFALLLFAIAGLGVLGIALGLVAAWVITAVVIGRMLGLDLEKSNTITSAIACPGFLIWLILGVLLVLATMSRGQ